MSKKREHAIQNEIRNALVSDATIFRANVGQGWQGKSVRLRRGMMYTAPRDADAIMLVAPRPFSTGLPNGFSDLFGWTVVDVEELVARGVRSVAVFTGIEVKAAGGRVKEEQKNFINAVKAAGGRAGIARSAEDAKDIINDSQ